jgi:hypothetical protein
MCLSIQGCTRRQFDGTSAAGSPRGYLTCSWGSRRTQGEELDDDSTDTDATDGEEIAQAPGLISLCLDEKILAPEMVGVFQGGGKNLILPSIVFEAQGFCVEGAIEA